MAITSKAMKNQNLFNTVAYLFGHNLIETEMDEIIKAVNLDTNDLKDHRIETLENQVKDLQKIKQDLQNKLLNSEKLIFSRNSQLKVSNSFMDSYSKKIEELEFELKDKDLEIDKLKNRIESLKFTILSNMVIILTVICMLVYYYFKQSI